MVRKQKKYIGNTVQYIFTAVKSFGLWLGFSLNPKTDLMKLFPSFLCFKHAPFALHFQPGRVSCYEGTRRFYFIYLVILIAPASQWRHTGWNCRAFKKRRWRESRSFFISHGAEGAACANASEIISAIRDGPYAETKKNRHCRLNPRINAVTCEHQERQMSAGKETSLY